jgi:triosephosphate isomerase
MRTPFRQRFIAANWKMHTTSSDAGKLARGVACGMATVDHVDVAICPPFPYLPLVGEILRDSPIALGAQNLYPADEGALTGEVSPRMLLDLGCKYVILGHSERRRIFGESDTFINQKVQFALHSGLDVILCVGETLDQRRANQTEAVLGRQLVVGLADLSEHSLNRLTIAYEPIWAIGETGHAATPEQAQDAHVVIRRRFDQLFGEEPAERLRIQYGGSVKPDSAQALLEQPDIDGALIGGASLLADEFLAIIRAGVREPQTAGRQT